MRGSKKNLSIPCTFLWMCLFALIWGCGKGDDTEGKTDSSEEGVGGFGPAGSIFGKTSAQTKESNEEIGTESTSTNTSTDSTSDMPALCAQNLSYRSFSGDVFEETPNIESCTPGRLSRAAEDFLMARLNYLRSFHGLPAISYDAEAEVKAQAAALIMAANGQLSHTPSSDWTCYSDTGSTGAGSSNLGLGGYTSPNDLFFLADIFIIDMGVPNAGHRRWDLCPYYVSGAFGLAPGSAPHSAAGVANYVFGLDYSLPLPEYVAWPPAGDYFAQFALGYEWDTTDFLWSFSVDFADFSNATVTITDVESGQKATVIDVKQASNGYCFNTLTYYVEGVDVDRYYRIEVKNVSVSSKSGNNERTMKDYSYVVRLVNCR